MWGDMILWGNFHIYYIKIFTKEIIIMKKSNKYDGTYSYKKEETGLVPTNTCKKITKECPLYITPADEKKKNIKERLLEWYDRHKVVSDMVSGAIVIAIIIFAIVFAVHSCNSNNPSSNVETTVSTSSSSTQATTVAATTKPKATESTTVQPTTTKTKKESSATTNNDSNNSNYSSGNSKFGKGGGNSNYSSGKTVSNYDTHEKDKDMSSDKDSKKDEGITGGNKGYGASISSKKESPSPEKKFEEEHTLPPTISQEEINKAPTVPLTPRSNNSSTVVGSSNTKTTTTDNQAE